MALTKLLTIPAANQRIGQSTLRFVSATDRQMRFGVGSNNANSPFSTIAANDFLIFGRIGAMSGVQAIPFWCPRDTNNQIGVYLNSTQTVLGCFWKSNPNNRDIAFTIPATSPNVPHCGSSLLWCWQRVGDQHRMGVVNGHTLTMSWSSWVTSIAATLGTGANWNNYAANTGFYINSSGNALPPTSYWAAMYSGLTFVAVTTGQMGAAGLNDDADVANVLLDPQRIFDPARTGILGILSYGDLHRGGSRLNSFKPEDIASGDTLVCPISGKTLDLTIGTNTGGSNKNCQVFPPHTLPTYSQPTINVDRDTQPASQSFVPSTTVGGTGLADINVVTIAGTSTSKRHTYLTVTDPATGYRVRPAIQVPIRMNYTDDVAGVDSKAVSYWMHITASADGHWCSTVNNTGDSLVIIPAFHSEGFNTGAGVNNIPSTNDCAWLMSQVHHYADPTSFSDDGFTTYEPQDSLVTWTENPGASSTHNLAISSYTSPAVIDGSGVYDNAVVTAIRNRLTSDGDNTVIWFKEGQGTQIKKIMQAGGSSAMNAAIPLATMNLGDGYFLVVLIPRLGGAYSYPGLIGFIGRNDAGFTNNNQWWAAGTGEVLDGTGPNTLTLPVNRGEDAVQFGYREQVGVSPETNKRAVECFEPQVCGSYFVALQSVGGVGSITQLLPTLQYTQLLLRTWRFNPTTKAMDQMQSVDLYSELNTVLGTDPNVSNTPEVQSFQSRTSIQPVASSGGFVLWIATRAGQTITNGTHYSDYTYRYGVRVIGLYFHDPSDLSKRTWLTEVDGVTLFKAWDCATQGGTACGPTVYGEFGYRSDKMQAIVFTSVGSTTTAMTQRQIVDASAAIQRAAAEFPAAAGLRSRVNVGIGVGL